MSKRTIMLLLWLLYFLLGKPSIKKTIFLLTFVNKRGGVGLERASSIKKTIVQMP